MKGWLAICLLIGSFAVQGQDVYESYQVDKACEPQGGQTMLQVFISGNLNVPIKAQADRVKGRVFVTGVVEPDGKITSLSVTRGLRPDCDREAMRVFALFNAWVPALKDGQKVRQRVNYPIAFAPGPPVYFRDGKQVYYFAKEGNVVADTAQTAYYQQTTPIDTLTGLPTGDQVIYERNGPKWREFTRLRLNRAPANVQNNDPTQKRTQLFFLDAQNQWVQTWYMLYPNGTVAVTATCENGRPALDKHEYAPNGMLEAVEQKDETHLGVVEAKGMTTSQRIVATRTRRTTWYPNGQLHGVELRAEPIPGQPPAPTHLISQWDSSGTALVTDGNGRATYIWRVDSRTDATKKTTLVESGLVRDGFREGNWTGRYADGSYKYDETYMAGIIQGGTSEVAGKQPITYTGVEQVPAPVGGMPALGEYLSRTLRYPPDAQRMRIQGKVFVSFVVNTDGSISDIQVLKGIGGGCDEEAVRVVKGMPRWQPGIQRGEPVRVKFNLPISFNLN